jgi:hypothetical protein
MRHILRPRNQPRTPQQTAPPLLRLVPRMARSRGGVAFLSDRRLRTGVSDKRTNEGSPARWKLGLERR